jgi:hypothetical protein
VPVALRGGIRKGMLAIRSSLCRVLAGEE